ncbi:hypothetical protein E2G14_24905 [Salmonella enterica subsp. enterica serovar Reading]|nr:hypothetical protein [Salmonella enterica subsp. enterica serovar Reading]
MCPSNPDGLTPPGAQTGRLIGGGVPRQQVAIIYDVGLSTHGLYWILLSAGREGVKKTGATQRSTQKIFQVR